MRITAALFLLFGLATSRLAALPAFPGAEGAGANAVGGRGGTVYHVTNTNDSGAGSLRTGVSVANRTIVFDVSGTINLQSDLKITHSNITIAGQTAPGDGITLKRRLTSVQNTHDVIVRFIRFRPGDADNTFQDDSFHFVNATNCIADHLSCSWSVDECLSVTHSTNISVQWCMISESLKNSQHDKGSHGYGTLLRYGYGELTFHHNLYQHHDSRNPRLGDNLKLDFVNNVIYNWGGTAGYSGTYANDIVDSPAGFTNYLNCINNYLVAGPSTSSSSTAFRGYATNTVIYHTGNRIDSNKNSVLDGSETGAAMFAGTYTASATRFPLASSVNADSAPVAYQRVLAFVGASGFRDEPDSRLIGTVRSHTGRLVDAVGPDTQATDYVTNNINGTNYIFVRGWPALNSTPAPADTDQDGMPDYWELNLGLSPTAANNNHVNPDGYTDLENYLNWLADLHVVGKVNQTAGVDLRVLTGNSTNLNFTVADGTNGSVTLAGDGYTARFQPATNTIGLASFTFNASNFVDHVAFGPMTVTVLITNAPPVILAQPASATNNTGETATFSVAAANAALNYQWRKGAQNISGATNHSLVLTNVSVSDAESYSVVITNFSGAITSSPATLTVVSNTPPTLDSIPDADVIAGATLLFTNRASDADEPAQTLTFSLVNAPTGATLGTNDGIFTWRPAISQAGTTNPMSIVVSDNGSPALTATQSFTVSVLQPLSPQLELSGGNPLQLLVTGSSGPDYTISVSTNLADWSVAFSTNSPSVPFSWTDPDAGNFQQRFYRIQLGP